MTKPGSARGTGVASSDLSPTTNEYIFAQLGDPGGSGDPSAGRLKSTLRGSSASSVAVTTVTPGLEVRLPTTTVTRGSAWLSKHKQTQGSGYHREHEALVVVGVLPDQVHSSGGAHRLLRGLSSEHLPVQVHRGRNELGQKHAECGSPWRPLVSITHQNPPVENHYPRPVENHCPRPVENHYPRPVENHCPRPMENHCPRPMENHYPRPVNKEGGGREVGAIHLEQSNMTGEPLTRTVSRTGLWPGPPPAFSGLKVVSGWHMKGGFSVYPHWLFWRNRPWFRSICSPEKEDMSVAEPLAASSKLVKGTLRVYTTSSDSSGLSLDTPGWR
ncbi:hypothetical protein EYF80_039230 [Liparis tanakae]|uniref:Uncharacterized protein n=1 Tax=Liparis tanakae TaxID=230148 RepID=A0A4Z2GBH7_9TELE|nr:hypothetical protein EYF80_039230 [Liparis tanakae]